MQKTTLCIMTLLAVMFLTVACDGSNMNTNDPQPQTDGDSIVDGDTTETETDPAAPAIRITMVWKGRMDMDITTSKKREGGCGTWAVPTAAMDLVGQGSTPSENEEWKKPCNTDTDCSVGFCTEYFDYSVDRAVKHCTNHAAATHDDTVGYLSMQTSWGVKDMDDVGCYRPDDPCVNEHKEVIVISHPKQGDTFRVAAYYNAVNNLDGVFIEPTNTVDVEIFVNGVRCETTFLASFSEVREAARIADITWATGTCEDVVHLPGWPHFVAPSGSTPLDPMNGTGSFWCDDVFDKDCVESECPTAATAN